MFKFITTPVAVIFLAAPALAQSTATPVVTGYLSASGCPGNQNPCFIQYGVAGGSGSTTASQGTPNTLANAWPVKITDATNGPAAVKAASTAPSATDPSLVVAISPNGINANGQAAMASSAPVVIASDQSAIPMAPSTSSGCTAYGLQSAASTNSTSVKGSAGSLCMISAINTTTTIQYLRMYDSASAPTCSSATNFQRTWPVPPAAASGGAGGFTMPLPAGTKFSNGIAFCLTGGGGSTDSSTSSTGVYIALDYK